MAQRPSATVEQCHWMDHRPPADPGEGGGGGFSFAMAWKFVCSLAGLPAEQTLADMGDKVRDWSYLCRHLTEENTSGAKS